MMTAAESTLTVDGRYRRLNYLTYPVRVEPDGKLSLRILLHRAGLPVDDDLPVELVRAVRHTDYGTYSIKPKRVWEKSTLKQGVLRLEVGGAADGERWRLDGSVEATPISLADAEVDQLDGILFTRTNLKLINLTGSQSLVREPHIVLPGVSQRFRQYTLMRFLDSMIIGQDAWIRGATVASELLLGSLQQLTHVLEEVGPAVQEITESARELSNNLRDARAGEPSFFRDRLYGVTDSIVAALLMMVAGSGIIVSALDLDIQYWIQEVAKQAQEFIDNFLVG